MNIQLQFLVSVLHNYTITIEKSSIGSDKCLTKKSQVDAIAKNSKKIAPPQSTEDNEKEKEKEEEVKTRKQSRN